MNHIIAKYGKSTRYKLDINFDASKETNSFFDTDSNFLNDNSLLNHTNIIYQINDELTLIINGYTLNEHILFDKFGTKDWIEIISKLRDIYHNDWVNKIEGNFSLFMIEKKSNKIEIYTNLTTSKPIFYFVQKDTLYFATNLIDLKNLIKSENIELGDLSNNAIYYYLVFGYYPSKYTCFENIYKLCGGEFLTFKGDKVSIDSYWKLTSEPYIDLKYDELLYELNTRFDNAVKCGFEKNIRDKKSTYVTLSGGLDSRMVALSANKQGYDFETFTFSINRSWDKIIAQDISKKISKRNTFIDLGFGEYLDNYYELIYKAGGTVGFQAAAHSLFALNKVNLEKHGIVMTGQVGDAIVGTTLNYFANHTKYSFETIQKQYDLNENKLFLSLKPFIEDLISNHSNSENYNYYNWVFNHTMSGDYIAGSLTEYYSPFLNPNFWMFLNRINPQIKLGHKLYFDWIRRFYPSTKNFFYQKTGRQTIWKNSTQQKLQRFVKYQYYVRCRGLYNKIMLPNDAWACKNREMMVNYIINNRENLPNDLYSDFLSVIKEGTSSKLMNLFTLVNIILK